MCDFSDLIQAYYGKYIWASQVYNDIKDNQIVIVDDWRRLTESDFLEMKEDVVVTTIYLSKPDKQVNPSEKSSSYEGNIHPGHCDIQFTYNSDYSNFEDVIGLIQNAIEQNTSST